MRFSIGLAAGAVLMLAGSAWAQEATPVAAPTASAREWRAVAPENLLVIDTNKGRILVELAPEVAPGHVERIRLLAGRGFFDNLCGTGSSTSSWPRPATLWARARARAPIPT